MQKDSLNEEKPFNFRSFWGCKSLASHVVFRRKSEMYCVYCGEKADTREHCPAKAFLKRPLPTDLPTIPACKKCNNGFSSDERYTQKMINFMYGYYINKDDLFNKFYESDDKETKEAKISVKEFINDPYFDDRMGNIFRKLAIGHAAYEISKGFYCDEWQGEPEYISYVIKPMISEEVWADLECAEVVTEENLPEIGSRSFGNIYVIQLDVQQVDTQQKQSINLCMLDWVDLQNGYYRYQAFLKEDKIYVKMIFNSFLYAEVVFDKKRVFET